MEHKYIIIAGTNKGGTTSLFNYLADHPAICPAFIKQTFFFLDKTLQKSLSLPAIYDYENTADFYQYFRDQPELPIRLEASPEYLYAPDTPHRLKSFLENHAGKVVLILRHPVDRFLSLFYFSKQQGQIPQDLSFGDYIKMNQSNQKAENTALIGLDTGNYSQYLKRYFEIVGQDKIEVYFFEDFMKDNRLFMNSVAKDFGIDNTFYDDYDFLRHNPTVQVKNRLVSQMYKGARSFLIKHTYDNKLLYPVSVLLKKVASPFYKKMNTAPLVKSAIDQKDIDFLVDFYQDEVKNMRLLLDREIPWTSMHK